MPNYAHVMILADEWLPEAREDFAAELEYVYSEFGAKAAEDVYMKVLDSVDNLRHFPRIGKHFSNMVYHGHEVRALSMRQTSLLSCFWEEKLLIIALWNNRRNNKNMKAMIQSR